MTLRARVGGQTGDSVASRRLLCALHSISRTAERNAPGLRDGSPRLSRPVAAGFLARVARAPRTCGASEPRRTVKIQHQRAPGESCTPSSRYSRASSAIYSCQVGEHVICLLFSFFLFVLSFFLPFKSTTYRYRVVERISRAFFSTNN